MRTLLSPYEKQQRRKTLMIFIWATLAASLLLTLYNIQFNSTLSIASLIFLDIVCIIALVLNYRGYYSAAAILISGMILIAITFNIYEGDGLYDSGVVAYPVFVTLGTLLFGKRSVFVFAFFSLLSLSVIAYLQTRGLIHYTVHTNDASNLIPMVVIFTTSALIIWVIMSNMEKNLSQLQQSEDELLRAYEMTLSGWAKALEYRDKETEGHSRRVVHLSERLARRLGCSEDEIMQIRRGAILHDIGKMGVPDNILLKPGMLDPGEWETMRKHPQNGKDILAGIDFLQPALSIVNSHHERWDGSGYPQGLTGKDIPLPARIFAIVDNWDALTSDRPYRKAWPTEKVIDYIRQNAGTMFDPEIVAVFLNMDK